MFSEAASSDPEARCGSAGEPVLCPGGAGVCRAAGISVLNAAADGWEAWKAASWAGSSRRSAGGSVQ